MKSPHVYWKKLQTKLPPNYPSLPTIILHGKKLPSDLSKILITSIFKKGDKSNSRNYWPILITCIWCKFMEHVVLNHLWSKSIERKRKVNLILLDFSKAFDRVLHEHLFSKLEYYGICGQTINWIRSLLNNHTLNVSVSDEASFWLYVILIPQISLIWSKMYHLKVSFDKMDQYNTVLLYCIAKILIQYDIPWITIEL